MRAPAFWQKRFSIRASLLSPIGFLYGVIASRRLTERGQRVGIPVICVGNFVMGGAGKTPTAIALAKLLRAQGETPAFLTRGYGGALSSKQPVVVRSEDHTARDVGDEALLLARVAPTIICADRPEGARTAMAHGASVVIMDDGLQNPSLEKDISVAVIDGGVGIGNGLTFPAGPLRAPLRKQMALVSTAIIIGEGDAGDRVAARMHKAGVRIIRAKLVPAPDVASSLQDRRVVAFAGIGRPEKFFATLNEVGAQIVARRSFDDHQPFADADLRALQQQSRQADAVLVTTEKDLVRLPQGFDAIPLPVELAFDQPDLFGQMLGAELKRLRASR
jgi:tetraacyldisaccharide 4'-kinase